MPNAFQFVGDFGTAAARGPGFAGIASCQK
jgi:hypothetical protein